MKLILFMVDRGGLAKLKRIRDEAQCGRDQKS
jgi:hypothetical protein